MGHEKCSPKCSWWSNFRLGPFGFIFALCLPFCFVGTHISCAFIGQNMMKITSVAKNVSFLGTYMAQLTCFEWKLSHLSPAFCIWHRWRNSRFWAIYFDIKIPNLVRRPRDLNISATPETCILVHEILHQGGSNHVLILQVQNASSSLALPSIRSNDGFVG